MSEKEKSCLNHIIDKVNRMDDADSKYILGLIDGMVIASESAGTNQIEEVTTK